MLYRSNVSRNECLYFLIFNHSRIKSDQVECGYRPASPSTSPRIIGGTYTQWGDWPWMISLRDSDNNHRCAAVVVSREVAVTAAHCVDKFETAVLGDLKLSIPSEYHLEVEVQTIIHPEYDGELITNDIALIFFDDPLEFDNNYTRPICLSEKEDPSNYTKCYVSGWGLTSEGYISDTMQEAEVELFSQEECESFYQDRNITSGMICAGRVSGDMDTCQGDTGGPLQCEDETGRMYLVGITSFGYGCGKENYPGVYTRAFEYLDFIENGEPEEMGGDVTSIVLKLWDSVEIGGILFNEPEKTWYVTTSDAPTLNITFESVNLERVFDRLIIGLGEDASDESTIIADWDTSIAHFYHIQGQSIWLKYSSDAVPVYEENGFRATVEAASMLASVSCINGPCGDSNICDEFDSGYSCTCLEERPFTDCHDISRYYSDVPELQCRFEDVQCGWEQVEKPRDNCDWYLSDSSLELSFCANSPIKYTGLISPLLTRSEDDSDKTLCFTFTYLLSALDGELVVSFIPQDTRQKELLSDFKGDVGFDQERFGLVDLSVPGSGWLLFEGFQGEAGNTRVTVNQINLSSCNKSVDGEGDIFLVPDMTFFLLSPNYPDLYPNLFDQTWLITAPEGYGTGFNFVMLDIEPVFDTLVFGVGHNPNENESIIRIISAPGSNHEPNIITGTLSWVAFHTDYTFRDAGFVIALRALEDSEYFRCNDSISAVSLSSLCNRRNDCPDSSDEWNCAMREGDVRLANGSTADQGRVEIYYNGQWGTICGDLWDDRDARVVCRQLGYPEGVGEALYAWYGDYSPGNGPIHLDDVVCDGNESILVECGSSGWNDHNCDHNEDAGVSCVVLYDGDVRLVGGSDSHRGRVEIYYNGQWGTVCDDSWDDVDAGVVCRQLGYPEGAGEALYYWDYEYSPGTGPIHLDNVVCDGSESSLAECGSNGWNNHDCGRYEDAGVSCEGMLCYIIFS
nr:uncharacterized protein LOC129270252 [Lytechinus pictus]